MPVIAFRVKSDRVHDIDLNAGTTIKMLRSILQEGGYDVRDALVTVYRKDDTLIGDVETYTLKQGDRVEFSTFAFELPAHNRAIKNAIRKGIAAQVAKLAANEVEDDEDDLEDGYREIFSFGPFTIVEKISK